MALDLRGRCPMRHDPINWREDESDADLISRAVAA
jgi:hypothetical protein